MSIFRSDLAELKAAQVNVPFKKRMMCLNESCLDPFPQIRNSFINRMEKVHLNRYFSDGSAELRKALSTYVGAGLSEENLLWGNGADDILYHIFVAVRENDQSFALSLAPSYFDYKTFALAVGLKIRFLDLQEDFSFDTEAYIQKASDPNCRVAILCNPNNPTGNLFAREQLLTIIQALPDKLVVVDETYFEFSRASFVNELERHPNLVLVRSFSKAFSSAGLRFGYAISSPENIQELKKVFSTFHLSILTQSFVLSILENQQVFAEQIAMVLKQREDMLKRLEKLPSLIVYPSATNFLTLNLGDCSKVVFDHLKENEIAVRDVGAHPRLRNCLRVTISCPEDNNAFIDALKAFWG